MRYREMTAGGDYRFGGFNQFLIDSPEAVAQAINTRLKLYAGQWFLDTTEGTDWYGSVLGVGTQGIRDLELQNRILNTPGVLNIVNYQSNIDRRSFKVEVEVNTIYGAISVELTR